MIAAYLQIGDLVQDTWVTQIRVRHSSWAGPAHFNIEGVLVGETTLFTLQRICLDDRNHNTYRIIDAQNNVYTVDARLQQVECNTENSFVRLILFLNSSSPQQHSKLWSPLVCYSDNCLRPPHEAHVPHSRLPEAM